MNIGVKRKTVKVFNYNSEWKNEYLKEKNTLKETMTLI